MRDFRILDTEPEPRFDEIVALAKAVFNAPIALVSLVDKERQWFKARDGLDVSETPRSVSFCAHAVEDDSDLVVTDAASDPRFAGNPLVLGPPHIRFYVGAVLRSAEGAPLGTLCVIDTKTRPGGLTPTESLTLRVLSQQVQTHLELHKARLTERARDEADHERDAREAELLRVSAALAASEARFAAIADSMPQMVWSTLPDGFHDYYNARWYEFTGVPVGSTDGEAWNGMFHPEDQDRAWARWRHSLETGEPYEIEYRLRHNSGVYRWTLGRALPIRDETGQIVRWMGTCTDIDALKRDEQAREVLSQELNHRIKNIFAVVSALVALSARQHPDARPFAGSLRTRIQALARAHDFVRPHTAPDDAGDGVTTLHAFLRELMAPYAGPPEDPTITIKGDDAVFDDQAATPVALLFHELATNAAKYGALSQDKGRIEITSRLTDEGFTLTWRETGGPAVTPPDRAGFGMTLANLAVEGQLGGAVTREWRPDGLQLSAILPVTALSRRRFSQKFREPDISSGG